LWAAEGISPEVVFEAMEIPTIEGLVAAGLGIAVVVRAAQLSVTVPVEVRHRVTPISCSVRRSARRA
jgi:hypothetical protein